MPDHATGPTVDPSRSRGDSLAPSTGPPAAGPWGVGPQHGELAPPIAAGCVVCDAAGVRLAAPEDRAQVTSPEAAAEVLVPRFGGADRERCLAALLDTKHRLVDVVVVSIGSIDHTFMSPREILRDALLANAAAVVLAHNHPSGDPEPSADDERVTRRLVRAGELVGIEVLDHLVVAASRWVSLARRGVV